MCKNRHTCILLRSLVTTAVAAALLAGTGALALGAEVDVSSPDRPEYVVWVAQDACDPNPSRFITGWYDWSSAGQWFVGGPICDGNVRGEGYFGDRTQSGWMVFGYDYDLAGGPYNSRVVIVSDDQPLL